MPKSQNQMHYVQYQTHTLSNMLNLPSQNSEFQYTINLLIQSRKCNSYEKYLLVSCSRLTGYITPIYLEWILLEDLLPFNTQCPQPCAFSLILLLNRKSSKSFSNHKQATCYIRHWGHSFPKLQVTLPSLNEFTG